MSKKCCKDCCECQCHRDGHIGVRGDIRYCKCHQPEIKVGGWCYNSNIQRVGFICQVGYDQYRVYGTCDDGKFGIMQWLKTSVTPHTLTKDDLCPCPYCGGEMKVMSRDKQCMFVRCMEGGDFIWDRECDWTSPLRKTEALAVADVLLLKIMKERFDNEF